MADGVQRELYTVTMKEEWEFYKSIRERTFNEDELLDAISYDDFFALIKLAAGLFLNEALGISDGEKLYREFECDTNCFSCRLSEAELVLVQGHEDVKEVLLVPYSSDSDY